MFLDDFRLFNVIGRLALDFETLLIFDIISISRVYTSIELFWYDWEMNIVSHGLESGGFLGLMVVGDRCLLGWLFWLGYTAFFTLARFGAYSIWYISVQRW